MWTTLASITCVFLIDTLTTLLKWLFLTPISETRRLSLLASIFVAYIALSNDLNAQLTGAVPRGAGDATQTIVQITRVMGLYTRRRLATFTNTDINETVDEWLSDKNQARDLYGNSSTLDTKR